MRIVTALFSTVIATVFYLFPAYAEEKGLSERGLADGFVGIFKSVCFDTDWIVGTEESDLLFLGFERLTGESVRRRYAIKGLYVASFLPPDSSIDQSPVCTLTTRWASAGLIRKTMLNWDFAGRPIGDEIIGDIRHTFWKIKYRRQSGSVLMEEETDDDGTTTRLSLIGE